MSIKVSDVEGKEWAEGYRAGMRDAVIHAHWEEQVYSGGKLFFRCSECGHGFTPVHGHTYNYCFCCGSKMDEVINDA